MSTSLAERHRWIRSSQAARGFASCNRWEIYVAYRYRSQLFGLDVEVRMACAVALVILGWAFARDLGRALGPVLRRRVDPGTAGTVSFLIQLFTLGLAILVALRIGGCVSPRSPSAAGSLP